MGYNKNSMLALEPRESIVFEGPFNRSQCKSLIIGNPSKSHSVAFKLKATSVRMFAVRPNLGTVGPDSKVTVNIFMQPITQDAGQTENKFLVQAALVSDGDTDMQKFWKEQKSADIWQAKIKCALVQHKSSEEQSRQPGGATSTLDPKPGGDTTALNLKPKGATTTFNPKPDGATTTLGPKPGGDTTALDPKPMSDNTTLNPKPEGDTTFINPKPKDATTTLDPKPEGDTITIDPKPKDATTTLDPKPEGDTTTLDPKPEGDTTILDPKPDGATTTHDPKPDSATTTLDPKPEGDTTTLDPEPEIDFDAVEISEPEAQLYKQISILEDERIVLKEEISILQDQTVVQYTKPLDMEFFIVASCALTILAAIVGAYCGKQYL